MSGDATGTPGTERGKAVRGSLLLLLGAVIWGAAFAAQRAGMELSPFPGSGCCWEESS